VYELTINMVTFWRTRLAKLNAEIAATLLLMTIKVSM
jgi:hypothetical protein